MFNQRTFQVVLASLVMLTIVASAGWAEEEETKVIENGNAVSVEYTLKLDDGTVVDTNIDGDPMTYKQGGSEILPTLEAALLGLKVGDVKQVHLTAEEGYGPVNPEGYQEVELSMVPDDAHKVGTMLMATGPEGEQQPIRVHEVKEETIVLDFNHPLAGQALNFDVKILAID